MSETRGQTIEGGVTVQCEVNIGIRWRSLVVTVKRNGILIFSPEPGFRPPIIQPQSQRAPSPQEIHVKEVVREVVLVVCPHCGRRNDASKRTCENCQASI